MDKPAIDATIWDVAEAAAARVRDIGVELGLPYIAAHPDFGDPEPMRDRTGRPFAETTFRWIDAGYEYWRDRKLALQSPFLKGARLISEPFYYEHGALKTWRASHLLDNVDSRQVRPTGEDYAAIICPIHLPRGVIGAVVWAGRPEPSIAPIFEANAERLFTLALKFISAHAEAMGAVGVRADLSVTRREAQCLKWAAAGKTDVEIGIIMHLSVSTVRFHLRNAAAKLGANSRTQAIQYAASLGFVGAQGQ